MYNLELNSLSYILLFISFWFFSSSIIRIDMKSNEPSRMLPRFDSDEHQSADTAIKTISETKINIDHSNKFDM